ncbi:MAG: PepSY-associated TM helix domain-containing protein [Methylococcales bacterium]|nr:PepSY-associated TM helix domain-containing protein [Methylococcales bacterium]
MVSKDARQSGAGDTFITWLHPLHSGEIAGLTGRWIIFISGFIPVVLYVTGFIRWRQKRAVKNRF